MPVKQQSTGNSFIQFSTMGDHQNRADAQWEIIRIEQMHIVFSFYLCVLCAQVYFSN